MSFRVDSVQDVFPLADFLAEAIGESAEIVVHDVTDLESSVVYICNGGLSDRRVGDGATDQALQLIKTGRTVREDFVSNYEGKSLGGRKFRCATYFVKNRADELVGLLCVNICVDGLEDAINTMSRLLGGTGVALSAASCDDGSSVRARTVESLHGNPGDTVRGITQSVLSEYPVPADRLSRDEKLDIIDKLNNRGVFLMKGAVGTVAEELATSTPTLYRYLQIIREQ